jgi:hypothetical protein
VKAAGTLALGFGAGGGVEDDDPGALVMVLSGVGALGASNTPFEPPVLGTNLLPPRSPPAPPGFAPPIGGAMPGAMPGGVAPPREGDVTGFCGPGPVVLGLVPAVVPGSL